MLDAFLVVTSIEKLKFVQQQGAATHYADTLAPMTGLTIWN